MPKYVWFDIFVNPHPAGNNWWLVSSQGYFTDPHTNSDPEYEQWDTDEYDSKSEALAEAKALARMVIGSNDSANVTILVDGSEYDTYSATPRAKKRHAGGKARHAPERSRLRPFATYCASCRKHISGSEHVWKIAGDKYLCDRCGGSAGGGKRRHATSSLTVGSVHHVDCPFRDDGRDIRLVDDVEILEAPTGRGKVLVYSPQLRSNILLAQGVFGRHGGGKRRHGGKWYVGSRLDRERKFEPFMATRTPTQESHGKKYGHSIGPFRTKGGAIVMARFGAGNPHLQTVSEAEKMAKREKAAGTLDLLMAEVKTMLK